MQLGVVTSLAIIAHEIPQEVGDYIVLLNAGLSRGRALLYNALSGLAAVAGGVIGYFVVGPWESLFPYLLVVASSSFIYVAVADLIPQLQQRMPLAATAAQLAWLAARHGHRHRRRAAGALTTSAGCDEAVRAAAPHRARSVAQRTTSTGIALCVSTFCVSLPSSSAVTPRRPWDDMTIRSQALRLGVLDDRLPRVHGLDGVGLAGLARRLAGIAHGVDALAGDALLGVEELLRRHRLHLGDGAVREGLLHAQRVEHRARGPWPGRWRWRPPSA